MEPKTPVEIADPTKLAAIGFDRIGVKIKRGTPIGSYDLDVLGLTDCFGDGGNVFWNQGRVVSRNLEFADLFFSEMRSANFNVVGNPDRLFENVSEDKRQAAYLVGGQIEDIKLNVCREKEFWSGYPRGTQRGKGAIRVKWQVFSVLERKVVYEASSSGGAVMETGAPDGELLLIQNAFSDATANFAADPQLVKLLSGRRMSVADIRKVGDADMKIFRYPERKAPITDNIDQIRLSSVLIEGGLGHGSGFFISPTLVMTNHHVVTNNEFVRITLLTGRKILGEVVRRHPKRDVALIEVEKSGHVPIPIRQTPLKITEEVYAIGAPQLPTMSGTVTKGIVSKFTSNRNGMEDIQADVDIQGGNSGGPLLDANGNLVGVSYAGIGPAGQFSSGLNFFIPIMDALAKLNVVLWHEEPTS